MPLLSTYIPFNISQFENIAVTPGGKRMYLVQNGSVHLFPNFDTMTALNISMKNVLYMGNWTEFSSIPEVRTPIYAPIYACNLASISALSSPSSQRYAYHRTPPHHDRFFVFFVACFTHFCVVR